MKDVQIKFRADEAFRKRLNRGASLSGKTQNEFIIHALEMYLHAQAVSDFSERKRWRGHVESKGDSDEQ